MEQNVYALCLFTPFLLDVPLILMIYNSNDWETSRCAHLTHVFFVYNAPGSHWHAVKGISSARSVYTQIYVSRLRIYHDPLL